LTTISREDKQLHRPALLERDDTLFRFRLEFSDVGIGWLSRDKKRRLI
jgi:hypothetical protein